LIAGEVAVLVEDGSTIQLNVLCVKTADQRSTILDVVEQTLGHEWVFVEVHQVSSLDQVYQQSTVDYSHSHTSSVLHKIYAYFQHKSHYTYNLNYLLF